MSVHGASMLVLPFLADLTCLPTSLVTSRFVVQRCPQGLSVASGALAEHLLQVNTPHVYLVPAHHTAGVKAPVATSCS